MAYIIYKTLNIVFSNNINNYQEFIENILPERLKENKILCFTISNIINIFLLISFNIMIAGFATYFIQELNISKWYGTIIIAILAFITLLHNVNGIIKINTYLIPIIIVLIVFLGMSKIKCVHIITENKYSINWILNSILYASYNSITLIPILISLKNQVSTKKSLLIISSYVAIIMIIVSVFIFLLMNTYIKEIYNVEIPIVYIASTLGNKIKYIYGIVVLMAIFTTAICAGYAFLNNVTKSRREYILCLGIICIISVLTGQMGFSNLINFLYPIFGYLGAIQLIFLLCRKRD